MGFGRIDTLQTALISSNHEVVFGLVFEIVKGTGDGGTLPVRLIVIEYLIASAGEYPVSFGCWYVRVPGKRSYLPGPVSLYAGDSRTN